MPGEEATPSQQFSAENYYSLLELLDKLGKEGVADLVSKAKPQRVVRGDMIYFLKSDINRLLGPNELEDSVELIVEEETKPTPDWINELVFHQALMRRYDIGKEEEIYRDKILDLSHTVVYGRSHGDPKEREIFKTCGIISSLHGKLYLDEDSNLLYQNLGANKSKIRGCHDKTYTILEKDEVGVLITSELLAGICQKPQVLTASIKIGYQIKPHFIIRIYVHHKTHSPQAPEHIEGDD